MKKLLIFLGSITILITGFYWGIQWVHSSTPQSTIPHPKVVEYPSHSPGKKIRLEYLMDHSPYNLEWRKQQDPLSNSIILEGSGTLQSLVERITSIDQRDIEYKDFWMRNEQPRFRFFIKYPPGEPSSNLLTTVSHGVDISFSSYDTTVSGYKALWNGKSLPGTSGIYLITESQVNGMKEITFENIPVETILKQYRKQYITHIKDDTGLRNRYVNVTLSFPKTIEEAIPELEQKLGIKLEPVEMTVKKLVLGPKEKM